MSGPLKVADLNAEAQQIVKQQHLDSGPDGVPDGVLDNADLPAIERVLTAPDIDPKTRALVEGVKHAVSNPLSVPRSQATAERITKALDMLPTLDGIEKLDTDTVRSMTVDERIRAITYVLNKRGYSGSVDASKGGRIYPKEQVLLDILHDTPDNQKGVLLQKLIAKGLNDRLLRAAHAKTDRAEYRDFFQAAVVELSQPAAVAQCMEHVDLAGNLDSTMDTIANLRRQHGDAFTEAVVSQLLSADAFADILSRFLYWGPEPPTTGAEWDNYCETLAAGEAGLKRLLAVMPRNPAGGEGAVAGVLHAEFKRQYHLAKGSIGIEKRRAELHHMHLAAASDASGRSPDWGADELALGHLLFEVGVQRFGLAAYEQTLRAGHKVDRFDMYRLEHGKNPPADF